MSTEIRPARPEEMERFAYVDLVGFGGQPTRENIERSLDLPIRADQTLCRIVDGQDVSQMAVIPYQMYWNGRLVDTAGVSSVATLPDQRRRGHLRALMTHAFGEMRERGQSIAILWASMAAIYQRFGYGAGCWEQQYRFDPRQVKFVHDVPVPGTVRLLPAEEAVPVVAGAYRRFARARTLMLERTQEDWHWQIHWPRDVANLTAIYEEDGEAQGFATYYMREEPSEEPGPWQIVNVRQFVWNSPAAHRALIQFLAGYDLAKQVRIQRVPLDDPLVYQVQEPRLFGMRAQDAIWLRLVDLQQALARRGYDQDGRLTLMVEDSLCPWNAGTWQLEVAGGAATVQRVTGEADLALSVRALATLCAGNASALALAGAGLIAPAGNKAIEQATRVFGTARAPLCLDHF